MSQKPCGQAPTVSVAWGGLRSGCDEHDELELVASLCARPESRGRRIATGLSEDGLGLSIKHERLLHRGLRGSRPRGEAE